MSTATASDALVILFNALSEEDQEDAYARISELRLRRLAGEESEMARFVRSMQRVTEHLGHVPSVDDYKDVSEELIAAGEDVETFARLYKHFGSWPRAKEALTLSETTTARRIEARFRMRKKGKVWRFSEDALRDAVLRCAKHFGRPPTTHEFEWWRERELQVARASGDDGLQLPSTSPYRRRYGSWEAALLHFGFTAEEAALRLDYRTPFKGLDPDAHLPDGLPISSLRIPCRSETLPLAAEQAGRVSEVYNALPRRSRYILTVRLGLGGVERRTLAATAKPLGLHLSYIAQVQLNTLNSLAEAATSGGRDRPDPTEYHQAIIETLQALAVVD